MPVSIYDQISRRHKQIVLIVGSAVALLTPFSDTIYLPVLTIVEKDLRASPTLVLLTVSAYMIAVAAGLLIWGPLSDRFGRRNALCIGMISFELVTIACIFSVDVEMLIALRCLQGFVVGSTITSVQAIIADIFAPHERGAAMGTFLSPMAVGPVIAPVLGGAVGDAFGWRGTFVLLAVLTMFISVLAFIVVPESHHYFVLEAVKAKNAVKLELSNTAEVDNFNEGEGKCAKSDNYDKPDNDENCGSAEDDGYQYFIEQGQIKVRAQCCSTNYYSLS